MDKKPCEGDALAKLLPVLRGNATVETVKHLIDCDAAPWCPDGWTVESHQPGGELEFDPNRIEFFLCDEQKDGSIQGNELRKKLEGKPVLNACVLDHLLANTNLISESWKYDEQGRTRFIFFWGTIYRVSGGVLCVRYLYWRGGNWDWDCNGLDGRFDGRGPAAILAS